MALLTIGGVPQTTPKEMKVGISDIDGETTRNANGDLIRDRIGTKRKLELEFPPLTQSKISTLLNAVSPVFFSVTFQDPQSGMITKTMYVGDRTAPVYRYSTDAQKMLWEGLSMNFIEK